eukprot:974312-Lingulodinium_polyedra.AAC.1
MARRGMAAHGCARLRMARRGMARHGAARRGMAWPFSCAFRTRVVPDAPRRLYKPYVAYTTNPQRQTLLNS